MGGAERGWVVLDSARGRAWKWSMTIPESGHVSASRDRKCRQQSQLSWATNEHESTRIRNSGLERHVRMHWDRTVVPPAAETTTQRTDAGRAALTCPPRNDAIRAADSRRHEVSDARRPDRLPSRCAAHVARAGPRTHPRRPRLGGPGFRPGDRGPASSEANCAWRGTAASCRSFGGGLHPFGPVLHPLNEQS